MPLFNQTIDRLVAEANRLDAAALDPAENA